MSYSVVNDLAKAMKALDGKKKHLQNRMDLDTKAGKRRFWNTF